MLFNVDCDRGDFLSGYVVGDGFVETLRIVVSQYGEPVYEGAADNLIAPLVQAGRHQTGFCGFALDEAAIPGLAAMEDLEIHEAASGVLIYRRPAPDHAARRVLRLESHLFPLWRLDGALRPRFQYAANRIETLGRETTMQMFLLSGVGSVYLSGRLLYRAFAHLIEGKFDVVFAMHHPYEELAERLIVLAQIATTDSGVLDLRANLSLGPTIAFAQSLPLADERALARALREIPAPVARVLANPVTRQLTTATPEEMPGKSALATALTTLASFAVVGLRRAPKTFAAALGELTGLPEAPPESTSLPGVAALARSLKRTREAEWLIEQDLALYAHIAEAYRGTADSLVTASHV